MNPEYVLDKMEYYEVPVYIENIYRQHKDDWERTRFVGYVVAQVNSSKKMKITDIIKFPWDDEKDTSSQQISDSDIKRLKEKAKQIYCNK